MGSRPLSTKNTGSKAQVALQNTKGAIMHKYNKAGVNRCKYNKVTTIQSTQTHTILQECYVAYPLVSPWNNPEIKRQHWSHPICLPSSSYPSPPTLSFLLLLPLSLRPPHAFSSLFPLPLPSEVSWRVCYSLRKVGQFKFLSKKMKFVKSRYFTENSRWYLNKSTQYSSSGWDFLNSLFCIILFASRWPL